MLLHTQASTHRCFYTQILPHTEAFTQRHFYTHTLLHADPFTHRRFYTQTLLRANPFTHKSFHPSFSHSTIISCERVARKLAKLQLYYTFGNQNVYESEQSAANAMLPCKKNHFTSVLDGRTSFRAKGLRQTRENRNFCISFWRSNLISCEKGCAGPVKIAILHQLSTIEPHFVRKGCARPVKIAILLHSFWRSKLVSCERVAFRAVSLALSRALREK